MPRIKGEFYPSVAIRILEMEYEKQVQIHSSAAPRNGIAVGGGDWMDSFFKMEAVRMMLSTIRAGKPLVEVERYGKDAATIAVKLWNDRREYQVRRWEQCCDDFVDSLIRRILNDA